MADDTTPKRKRQSATDRLAAGAQRKFYRAADSKSAKAQVYDEMLTVLRAVELKMSNTPAFNPRDLGPSPILQQVRAAIASAEDQQ